MLVFCQNFNHGLVSNFAILLKLATFYTSGKMLYSCVNSISPNGVFSTALADTDS